MTNQYEELYGYRFEDLSVGMKEMYSHTMTETDIRMFAAMSGDSNPIHLNEEFAASTRFGGRIAHGLICASFISAIFGTKLPGPGCVYVSQTLKFKAPVKIGDTVVVSVTITELVSEKRCVKFDTICTVRGKAVIKGEAELYVPPRDEIT